MCFFSLCVCVCVCLCVCMRLCVSLQVFLLAHCEDNALYVRTLATGKELHTLKGHKSKVS